jgi:hypothetical protein
MRRGKKAVSELVAILMLVSITVAAAFVVYVYSSGLLGSLTGAQPQSGLYTNQITLEYYDWTNGGKCSISYTPSPVCTSLVLSIRNVGSGLANIAAYYVSGTQIISASISSSTCSSFSGAVATTTTVSSVTSLAPQASCTVTLSMPTTGLTITPGVAYSVKIATNNGGVFAYTCIAGQRTGSY